MAESSPKIPKAFDAEIYQMLNDIDNLLYFQWDLKADVLEFTTSVNNSDYDLSQRVQPASTYFWGGELIHPDDNAQFCDFLDEMFWMHQPEPNDHRLFSSKVRLRGKNRQEYLWAEFRLLVYFNESEPVVAFGCICNINVKQLWQMELQHSAEHDVLTGFYNKTACQKHATEYLDKLRPTDSPPALLIIDADGFKAINDTFGHLFGDAVLTDMGLAIRSNFHQSDIIGRIGGDEFVVLLCELPSMAILQKLCQELLKSLNRTYKNNDQELPFSVSIGVALYPEHGMSYEELFKHADRALYESKSRGKNQYSIYRSSLLGRSVSVSSERDPQRMADMQQKAFQDNMLEFIFNLFYETQNPDMTIAVCLSMFGKQFHLDRVAVDRYTRSANQYTNAFEWCSPNGISLHPEQHAKDLASVIDSRYALINSLYRPTSYGVMSICQDTRHVDAKYMPMIRALRMGSFAYCRISHGTEDIGCVGFESIELPRTFTKEELTNLGIFAVLLGNILLDRQTDRIAERMNRHLQNILDHMQEFIYVVDKENYEPIFFNRTIRQTLLGTSTSQPCYRRFHHLDSPCEGCPVMRLSKNGNEYIDVKLDNWGVPTSTRAYNIHWEDEQNRSLALIIQDSF